jgi:peroxiredoxin
MLNHLTSFKSGNAARPLRAGEQAPSITTRSVSGSEIIVPDPLGALIHLQFLRFAGCPVCNLLLQHYINRSGEIREAGIREIIVFHSEKRFIQDYHDRLPFEVIADPNRRFFNQYRVKISPLAILNPRAFPNLIRGYRLRAAGKQDSSPFGLPAEFLIHATGRIVASHYGSHSSDQWSVDEVLQIASSSRRAQVN